MLSTIAINAHNPFSILEIALEWQSRKQDKAESINCA